MDPILASIGAQIPMAVLIFIVTDRLNRAHAAERMSMMEAAVAERKTQREWFEGLVGALTTLIRANTDALSRTAEAMGEVSASRFACPASTMGDRDSEGRRYQRHRANGRVEEDGSQ